MIKELEAFHKIMEIYGNTNSLEGTYDNFLTIKKALQRLETIDNTEPSEAMECLEKFFNSRKVYEPNNTVIFDCIKNLSIIKQSLQKAQEQEKVLSIIFEKGLPLPEIDIIKQSKNYDEYCAKWSWLGKTNNIATQKTQEEFELLKRWLDENN